MLLHKLARLVGSDVIRRMRVANPRGHLMLYLLWDRGWAVVGKACGVHAFMGVCAVVVGTMWL